MTITYEWRGDFTDGEVDGLHAESFGHPPLGEKWRARLHRHSLGWVCARRGGVLVGFVNLAWDGGAHAFVLDTMVAGAERGAGVGAALVAEAAQGARAAGCAWLHVDYERELEPFYLGACGFKPTAAGLLAL
ncbi:GNAT family N-acetyltransferase [Streptomyces sp. Ru71]|uniref:GNAT family N-acetyltransferase n=1 Tax=Streptomyces sp. Ru71 TaxID=2080746 RepID=UPI000CDE3859|nr:GNAT family N-acetyltransferase [Streptomyces sp. Ru71]POX51329.1 GNAT family N-acetyltransferase [Streptomyces sp. Ru71]